MYGSGYMNLERLLGVNKDRGEQQGGALANDVSRQGEAIRQQTGMQSNMAAGGQQFAQGGVNPAAAGAATGWATPDQAGNVERQSKQLGTQQGRQQALSNKYGAQGGYGAAQSGFDALVSGWSGDLQNTSQAYANLAQQVGAAQKQQADQAVANKKKTEAKAADDAYGQKYHNWDQGRTGRQSKVQALRDQLNQLITSNPRNRNFDAERAIQDQIAAAEADLNDWLRDNPPPAYEGPPTDVVMM